MSAGPEATGSQDAPAASAREPRKHGPPGRATALWRQVVDRLSVGDGTFDRPPLADVVLATLLLLPALSVYAWEPSSGVQRWSFTDLAGWLLLVVGFGALAWRRVTPTMTMMVAGLATGAWFLVGHSDGFIPLAVMVALYSVAAYGSRADGISSLVITEVFVVISFLSILMREHDISLIQLAVNVLMFLGIWVLGDRTRVRRELVDQLRSEAEQAERSRELTAELAVSDERTRIARELHDVVAHSVSVMVIQAGAGRRVAQDQPERATEVLAAIEDVGRDALADLRRMVGVLRDQPGAEGLAPQPSLADLDELAQRLAAAGLPVRVEHVGEPRRVPSGLELTAYRIVQEGLTNVIKHAGAVCDVVVTVRHGDGALVVEVDDDGRGAAAAAHQQRTSSGLLGMRERVAVFDGRLHVGPRPGGGFRVRAVLPIPPEKRDDDHRSGAGYAAASDRAPAPDPDRPVEVDP